MHTSHAAFTCCEEHRQELLSFAEQHELVKLACTGTASVKPHKATTLAIQVVVHRLTAFMSMRQRERPSTGSDSTVADHRTSPAHPEATEVAMFQPDPAATLRLPCLKENV